MPNSNAIRQARYKARMASLGDRQVNLMAPEAIHPVLKEIARRARTGEDLAAVLVRITKGLAGKRLAKLEMRGEALANRLGSLPPAPAGKVNIAVALAAKASGGIRRALRGLGLVYQDRLFAGPVDAEQVDDLRRRVQATGGALVAG